MFLRMGYIVVGLSLLLWSTGCSNVKSVPSPAALTNAANTDTKQVELLSQAGDEVYQKTIAGEFAAARSQILAMEEMIVRMHFTGITSIYGIKVLTDTLVQAERVFNAAGLSVDDVLFAAAKLRLATDALSHPNMPMWLQYEKLIQDDISALEQSAKQKQGSAVKRSFQDLQAHYETIRPAIIINREMVDVEKADSLFSFYRTQLTAREIAYDKISGSIKQFQEIMERIFHSKGDRTAYLPILLNNQSMIWALILCLFIVSILSFAAWRMYRLRDGIVRIPRDDRADRAG